MKINNKLKLAAAIAAGMALVGCGSDDKTAVSTSLNPEKAFNCEADTTIGSRTICIGSANNLTDATIQDELFIGSGICWKQGDTIILPQGR